MTVCESTGDLMMILTLAEDGNLNRQIQKAHKTSFAKIADIVTRLAFNLASLHDDIGMCHRNIHSENILCVDEDYFLVDFRFSTSADEASDVTKQSQVHYGKFCNNLESSIAKLTSTICRPCAIHCARSEEWPVYREIRRL